MKQKTLQFFKPFPTQQQNINQNLFKIQPKTEWNDKLQYNKNHNNKANKKHYVNMTNIN